MEKLQYGTNDIAESEKNEPVTTPQKRLLLGSLLIGFVFHQIFFSMGNTEPFIWVSCAWVCYCAVFLAFNMNKAKTQPYSFVFLAAALYLCVITPFQAEGYSEETLAVLNVLAVPCLLMVHAQIVSRQYPLGSEANYAAAVLNGFFVQPFIYIGRFFAAVGNLFKKKNSNALIGALIAIPLGIIVLSLLLEADLVMGMFAKRMLADFYFSELFFRAVLIFVIMTLFYSFIYGVTWGGREKLAQFSGEKWPSAIPRIVVGTLLVIYAVFTAVQFVYLFGGHGLPEGLTYSEYAREGFSQLLWVAVINLSVFSICLCRVEGDKVLRAMMLTLLAASAIILASSFTRLFLYIDAYGLTFKRIQALWLLIYLSFTFIMCAVRSYKAGLPLLRMCVIAFVAWYVLLNIPDLTVWYT